MRQVCVSVCLQKLDTLSMEVSVHSNFRVWIPLPLEFFVAIDLGPGLAIDGLEDKVVHNYSMIDVCTHLFHLSPCVKLPCIHTFEAISGKNRGL